MTEEVVEEQTSTQDVVNDTESIVIDTTDCNPTYTAEQSAPNSEEYFTLFYPLTYIDEEMQWAYAEIIRCNDYIYAKADQDRRFSVYRDELYEYRYKFRQLVQFDPRYPDIPKSAMPVKPDYVPDA